MDHLYTTNTSSALIQTFVRQVNHKPDLSEMQGTLLELTLLLPQLVYNSDYRAIMAPCFMCPDHVSFTEMSDLIYAYEKRISMIDCCRNLATWLTTNF